MRSFVGEDGPEVMVVSGATVSTLNDRPAGVASTLPAASRARTWKVCAPFARAASGVPLVQAAKAPPSIEHSKLAAGSFELKVNVGVLVATGPFGPESMVVSGASASTDQS